MDKVWQPKRAEYTELTQKFREKEGERRAIIDKLNAILDNVLEAAKQRAALPPAENQGRGVAMDAAHLAICQSFAQRFIALRSNPRWTQEKVNQYEALRRTLNQPGADQNKTLDAMDAVLKKAEVPASQQSVTTPKKVPTQAPLRNVPNAQNAQRQAPSTRTTSAEKGPAEQYKNRLNELASRAVQLNKEQSAFLSHLNDRVVAVVSVPGAKPYYMNKYLAEITTLANLKQALQRTREQREQDVYVYTQEYLQNDIKKILIGMEKTVDDFEKSEKLNISPASQSILNSLSGVPSKQAPKKPAARPEIVRSPVSVLGKTRIAIPEENARRDIELGLIAYNESRGRGESIGQSQMSRVDEETRASRELDYSDTSSLPSVDARLKQIHARVQYIDSIAAERRTTKDVYRVEQKFLTEVRILGRHISMLKLMLEFTTPKWLEEVMGDLKQSHRYEVGYRQYNTVSRPTPFSANAVQRCQLREQFLSKYFPEDPAIPGLRQAVAVAAKEFVEIDTERLSYARGTFQTSPSMKNFAQYKQGLDQVIAHATVMSDYDKPVSDEAKKESATIQPMIDAYDRVTNIGWRLHSLPTKQTTEQEYQERLADAQEGLKLMDQYFPKEVAQRRDLDAALKEWKR